MIMHFEELLGQNCEVNANNYEYKQSDISKEIDEILTHNLIILARLAEKRQLQPQVGLDARLVEESEPQPQVGVDDKDEYDFGETVTGEDEVVEKFYSFIEDNLIVYDSGLKEFERKDVPSIERELIVHKGHLYALKWMLMKSPRKKCMDMWNLSKMSLKLLLLGN
ncbi:hypothetical protein LINGRAHAP2_LOCUS8108 [Linum grandiflorum]